MYKTAIALSIGAAALFMTVEAGATDRAAMVTTTASTEAGQATDMSARRRHYRQVRYYRGHRSYYAPSYGYYQQPYYQPAPSISFGFGGGPHYYGGRGYGHRGW